VCVPGGTERVNGKFLHLIGDFKGTIEGLRTCTTVNGKLAHLIGDCKGMWPGGRLWSKAGKLSPAAAQQFKKAKANVHKEAEKVQQIMVCDKQFPHPLMKVSFTGMTQAFRSSQQVDKLKITIGIDDAMQQQTDLYIGELMKQSRQHFARHEAAQRDRSREHEPEAVHPKAYRRH